MTAHNLKNLTQDDSFKILITDDEYCPMDYHKAERMLLEVESSWTSKVKNANTLRGRTLEDLCCYLLSCVIPFSITYDLRTPTNQIDILTEVLAFDGHNPFLQGIGQYFASECKNENRPVGVTHVEKFSAVLEHHNLNFGIIFSRKGLTGLSNFREAHRFIVFFLARTNKRILNITYEDIKRMLETRLNFLSLLRQKNHALVFQNVS